MGAISARILRRGQVTLPRRVREIAHLEEGDRVEFEVVPEGILMRPQKVIDATQAWYWTAAWQAGEARASADIAHGRVTRFTSDEEFLASLDD